MGAMQVGADDALELIRQLLWLGGECPHILA